MFTKAFVYFHFVPNNNNLEWKNAISSKGGGVAAIFDSQTENFLSQKGQSTKPSETELC